MYGIEGAGSIDILRQLAIRGAPPIARGAAPGDAAESPGLEGAMALSRKFLSAALDDAGFVDPRSSSIERLTFLLRHGWSRPEEVEPDFDLCTAALLADYLGERVTGEVNRVLRVLARVDPERVAALLK